MGIGLGTVGLLAACLGSEVRVTRPEQSLTDAWRQVPIEPRGTTRLGLSFRLPQLDAFGLEALPSLQALLAYPFEVVRLGAYWNRLEPAPGCFDPSALDPLVEAAERAGKQIVLCVGALKTFGYPEFFVPAHHLPRPLPEHRRIDPSSHPALLAAAQEYLSRVVAHYRGHAGIAAWQVEHEAVDPLGLEHSWRLDRAWVEQEVATVRAADPSRPILMNGYLPTSTPVRLTQWWQTRDQGDSLAVAQQVGDIVGLDVYPRHALLSIGGRTLYLDGSRAPWQQGRRRQLFAWACAQGGRLMVSEGQAEPWEAVTMPPSPPGRGMASCQPERLLQNYNQCLQWSREAGLPLEAYLFWGAEYWLLRQQQGDPSYLQAFARILDQA
jgi:hypothetical protein